MACIKFSLLLLGLLSFAHAQVAGHSVRFSSKSCLDASYSMNMTQKGPLFGLLKQEFVINKEGCLITIQHKKYFTKEWVIDVCREPVHIKVSSSTGVDVAKKTGPCVQVENSKDTGDFCSQYQELLNVIQDEGLIFATGDRDDLASDHGKTYCSYLLIKRYLEDGSVFSRYTEVMDIFPGQQKVAPETVAAPVVEEPLPQE